jgi:PLD-like domain/Helix-hairpin-helix motif
MPSLKLSAAAAPLMTSVKGQDAAAQALIAEAVAHAAGVDGDRVLDAHEAQAVKDTFDALSPSGAALDVTGAQQLKELVFERVLTMKAARPHSTDVAFTSEGDALIVFRQKILGAIDQSLAKANGKPVDINMMLFAFTDRELADALEARARSNPNLTIRVLTDWSMLADSGDRQPPRLARLNLPNLMVKFKADAPYTWSNGGPQYNHGSTLGLNHHKGFVALIDGRPEKMTLGSFNWSVGAMDKNYENLMVLDRHDADNRRVMAGYEKEFEGFWNSDEAALSYREALTRREDLYDDLAARNGGTYARKAVTASPLVDPAYQAVDQTTFIDVNSLSDKDHAALASLIGKTRERALTKELLDYGRFDSIDELLERVPTLATLSAAKLEELRLRVELGEGGLSVNTATESELDRAGFSARQAKKILERRAQFGSFENLEEVQDACGISKTRLALIGINLSDDEAKGFYSARTPGSASATTGWSTDHHGPVDVTATPDGTTTVAGRPAVEPKPADLAAPVADLLRRAKPGEVFRMAMYGLSANSPEFAELVAAAERGVAVRAVVYKEYNAAAIEALRALGARGLDVQVKVIASRVMHEKFGVLNDDVWNGSANFSTSSITKHTEDRFLFRNMPELAARFVAEFDRLWARGS